MAKKGKTKKDKEDLEKDENINEGTQDDINEADDSFGLPDIDYKPLDEIEDEPESSEPEPESEPEEVPVEASSEATEGEFETDFIDDSADFEEKGEEEAAEIDEESIQQENAPIRKFEHPKESSSAPKIIIGILLAIIVLAAGYYFGFYKPQQAEKARQEQAEQERIAEEARQREAARQAELARQREAEQAEQEAAEAEPEIGTVTAITEPTGRYYVVIGSFVDDDLAYDYGNKIAANGTNSMILSPAEGRGFFRLALSDFSSWAEAQSVADQMKGEYGDQVWVFKY